MKNKRLEVNVEGRYSITRPYESKQILKIMKNDIINILESDISQLTITDTTAGAGGDTISFSNFYKNVNSIEICKENYDILEKNCLSTNNVQTFNCDCLYLINNLHQDIIYCDPPWGGVDYKLKENINLFLSNTDIKVFLSMFMNISKIVYIKVPINFDFKSIPENYEKFKIYNRKRKISFFLIRFTSNFH